MQYLLYQPMSSVLGRKKLFSLCGRVGFTLIEVLVGMAVLGLVVVLLSQAASHFSRATISSTQRLESGRQVRALFDRMDFDLRSAINRAGTRIDFRKNESSTGAPSSRNDSMVFLTQARSSDPGARLAVVGYEVGEHEMAAHDTVTDTVLRHVDAFSWSDDATRPELSSATQAQAVAPGILRFELSFVDADGNHIASPPAGGGAAEEAFFENIREIVCTVATVDENTLQILSRAQLQAVRDRLPDAVNGESPLANWQALDLSTLPSPVNRSIRFHQRIFPMP